METISIQELIALAGNNASVIALYFLYKIVQLLIGVNNFARDQQKLNEEMGQFVKEQREFNKEVNIRLLRIEHSNETRRIECQ